VSRTLALPPTDRSMWRQLLKLTHPDGSGSHDLFIWTRSLYEYVAGDAPEEAPPRARRQPPRHPTTGERVDYVDAYTNAGSFHELTRRAVDMASRVGEPYASLLRLLVDCQEAPPRDVGLFRQQSQGASYRSLAAIAHRAGLSKAERQQWYRVAEQVPLSQRHVSHLMSRLL
jgi:hypothetical protein